MYMCAHKYGIVFLKLKKKALMDLTICDTLVLIFLFLTDVFLSVYLGFYLREKIVAPVLQELMYRILRNFIYSILLTKIGFNQLLVKSINIWHCPFGFMENFGTERSSI